MTKLLLIGCGKMGGALRTGWTRAKVKVTAIDPNGAADYRTLTELPTRYAPDVIVLAVKPQLLDDTLPDIAARFGDAPLYLSIAAGKTLAYYKEKLGAAARVIRAMPNTPALVGQGMTVLAANAQATQQDRMLAATLFDAVGKTHWLADESLIHAATAISGSGPAYVFLFLEALTEAGAALGLSPELATELATQTVAGAAALTGSDSDFATLRKNVTSPGGTTEAALSLLMEQDVLKRLLAEAACRAAERSRQLS